MNRGRGAWWGGPVITSPQDWRLSVSAAEMFHESRRLFNPLTQITDSGSHLSVIIITAVRACQGLHSTPSDYLIIKVPRLLPLHNASHEPQFSCSFICLAISLRISVVIRCHGASAGTAYQMPCIKDSYASTVAQD